MIDVIFTLDYEIFGNGTGSLKEHVYEPAEQLCEVFLRRGARFVAFVEALELEKIAAEGTDPSIDAVERQVRALDREGFEIALHLHPQWANARYERGQWLLDFDEYNLCTLPAERIAEIASCALAYLRHVTGRTGFAPLSFRAGSWLFQPAQPAAAILAQLGIRIDSSVFKGGLLHSHNLDYRPALQNGYYWPFDSDASKVDARGEWIELPIHTEMVPLWKMPRSRRGGYRNALGIAGPNNERKAKRLRDFLRYWYPLKLDFCRMTLSHLRSMIDRVVQADRADPGAYRPIVAIGHTKDLNGVETIDAFLRYLIESKIRVATFEEVYPKLLVWEQPAASPMN